MIKSLLLLIAFACTSALCGMELKPGQDLPYARVTVTMPDGPNRSSDGFWDPDYNRLFVENDEGHYPAERVVSVVYADPAKLDKHMTDAMRRAHADVCKVEKAKKKEADEKLAAEVVKKALAAKPTAAPSASPSPSSSPR